MTDNAPMASDTREEHGRVNQYDERDCINSMLTREENAERLRREAEEDLQEQEEWVDYG